MKTNDLKTTQNNFQAFLLEGENAIQQEVVPEGKASIDTRLAIYRNAYYLRLIDILGMDYGVLKTIVGPDTFKQLAVNYINAHPSKSYSIRAFGRNFPQHLTTETEIPAYLAEMANFEWELTAVLEAKDAPHVTIEEMSQVPPDAWATLKFELHPSVKFMDFQYNIPEIWKLVREDEQATPNPIQSETKQHWLLWRFNLESYFAPLNTEQLFMLQAIQAGKNFGEICEELCQWLDEEEVIQFAAGNLRTWIGDGVFSALITAS